MPHCHKEHYSPEPGALIQRPESTPMFINRCEVRTTLIVLVILFMLKKFKVL